MLKITTSRNKNIRASMHLSHDYGVRVINFEAIHNDIIPAKISSLVLKLMFAGLCRKIYILYFYESKCITLKIITHIEASNVLDYNC